MAGSASRSSRFIIYDKGRRVASRLTIGQCFSAGSNPREHRSSPVRDDRTFLSSRPGLSRLHGHRFPSAEALGYFRHGEVEPHHSNTSAPAGNASLAGGPACPAAISGHSQAFGDSCPLFSLRLYRRHSDLRREVVTPPRQPRRLTVRKCSRPARSRFTTAATAPAQTENHGRTVTVVPMRAAS